MMIVKNDKVNLICDYCINDVKAIDKNENNKDCCFMCLLEEGLI